MVGECEGNQIWTATSMADADSQLSSIFRSLTLLKGKDTEVTWRKQSHRNKKQVHLLPAIALSMTKDFRLGVW